MRKIKKSEEIVMLETMRDTDSFMLASIGKDGINKMIDNIQDDLDLIHGVAVTNFAHTLAKDKASEDVRIAERNEWETMESLKSFRSDVLAGILCFMNSKDEIYINTIIDIYSSKQIVLAKIQHDIHLTDDEKLLVHNVATKLILGAE